MPHNPESASSHSADASGEVTTLQSDRFLKALALSLYEATKLIEKEPELLTLSQDPSVQLAAQQAVIKALRSGDVYDPPRFVKLFGVDVAPLQPEAGQLALAACSKGLAITTLGPLLTIFRPDSAGNLDRDIFSVRAPYLCNSILEGSVLALSEAIEHLHFPEAIQAYRHLLPAWITQFAKAAEISSMPALANALTSEASAAEWRGIVSSIDTQSGEVFDGILAVSKATQLSCLQVAALAALGLDPSLVQTRAAAIIRDESVDKNATVKLDPTPESVTAALLPFVVTKTDPVLIACIGIILEQNGVTFPPQKFPGTLAELARFNSNDWDLIRRSPEPLVTIQGVVNAKRPGSDSVRMEGIEDLRLVHTTSLDSLRSFARHGQLLSHRAATESGFITRLQGSTYDLDQVMGLDTVVFFDFGRPNISRLDTGQVRLHFRSSILEDPGTFVTAHDFMDYLARAGVSEYELLILEERGQSDAIAEVRRNQARAYLADMSVGHYSFAKISQCISAANLDLAQFVAGKGDAAVQTLLLAGEAALGFRPPEVKAKHVGIKDLVGIEFTSEALRQEFVEEFPELASMCMETKRERTN